MAKTPAPKPRSEDESQLVGAAFDSARGLTSALGAFADCARADRRAPMPVGWWKRWGPQYASGFVAWHALSHFYLSPAVRRRVKSAYPLSADPVRLGKARPAATVIEAIADELGVAYRNLLFHGRASPLDPPPGTVDNSGWAANTLSGDGAVDSMLIKEKIDDWNRRGIRNWGDAYKAIEKAWREQTDDLAQERLAMLKFSGVDFDDLLVRLEREALACCPAPQGAHNAISSALNDLAADGESLRENPRFKDGGTPMHAEKAAMCVRAAIDAGLFAHPRYQLLRAELSTYREGVAQWVVAVEWLREPTTALPIAVEKPPTGNDSATFCFPEDARAFAQLIEFELRNTRIQDTPPNPDRDLKPLSPKAIAVYKLLCALPPYKGLTGASIIDQLSAMNPPVHMDQSTLTKRVIPELKPRGVVNKPRIGYYLLPEHRKDAIDAPQQRR